MTTVRNLDKIFLLVLNLVFSIDMSFGQDDKQQVIHLYFTEQDTTDKDTVGEQLLISRTWQTCAWIDSINQFYKIQFINKNLIDTVQNCTSNGCAYSDWTFEIENGEKKLTIFNTSGCPDGVLMTGNYYKWIWEYDNIGRVVRLMNDKGEDKFHLLVKQINENRLFLLTFKQDDKR